MRLKLVLIAEDKKELPIDYFYPLGELVYSVFQFNSEKFIDTLRKRNIHLNGEKFKCFSYSLRLRSMQILDDRIILINPMVDVHVSSPYLEGYIEKDFLDSLINTTVEFVHEDEIIIFSVKYVHIVEIPKFSNEQKFSLLSPLVISSKKMVDNKLLPYCFKYDEDLEEINKVFNDNLYTKYKIFHNKSFDGEPVSIQWDNEYIQKRLKQRKNFTKKIKITMPNQHSFELFAYEIPFTIKGDPRLIEIGYLTGFGEKNSYGFGMAEIVQK